jgi:hypothetical protein
LTGEGRATVAELLGVAEVDVRAPATTLSRDALVQSLRAALASKFQDDYLDIELDAVIQALVNSVGWAAIRYANSIGRSEPVRTLVTTDGLAVERSMPRRVIVKKVGHTSGLDLEQSAAAIKCIESSIDTILEYEPSVAVEHIGVLRRSGSGYLIELDKGLQV